MTDPLPRLRPPTPERPLLGRCILLVEDSRYASDAIRLLSLASGARIRRADSLAAAERHLAAYRPDIAIVDLGLPDGSGAALIERLDRARPRVPAVIGISGEPGARGAAAAAGADTFLEKPVTSLASFQEAILPFLPADLRPCGPRALPAGHVTPDDIAYRDDLAHAASLLGSAGDGELDYLRRFLSGLARSAGDEELRTVAEGPPAALAAVLATRLERRMAV